MKQRYLVVYERTADESGNTCTWGGTSPDILGCGSVGETLEEMRAMMKEAVEGHFQCMAADGDLLPEPLTTSIDFSAETPEEGVAYCVVEWLEVEVPASAVFAGPQSAYSLLPAAPALTATTHNQGHHG
jgi:predicted RNase H-like HicB family nuclease